MSTDNQAHYDDAQRRGQWVEWSSVDFATGVESSASHLLIPLSPAEFYGAPLPPAGVG